MKQLETRLAKLEQQTVAVAPFKVVVYDLADGEPPRQPHWPGVIIFLPDNFRDVKTGG